jgi:hypothetical protein
MNAHRALCAIVIGQSVVLSPVFAQNTLTVPSEVVHTSNPGLSPDNRGSVTLLRTSPQYTILREDAGVLTEFVFGGLIERSSDTNRSANRSLPRAGVRWQNAGPLSTLELRASLEEESTRTTEFADFGRVTLDSTARTGLLGARWERELSATSSLELSTSYRRVNYDTASFVDFDETQGEAVYAFQAGVNARYSLAANVGHLNFAGPQRSASLAGLRLGYERNLSENLTLNAVAGAVRTNLPRSQSHAVGSLRLENVGERLGYAVAWSRDVRASSLGGYERFTALEASMTYPLTANTMLSLGAGRVQSLGASDDAGTNAFARVRTELSRYWSLTTGVEFRHASPASGPSARGHSVAVGLVYENPNF